MGFRIREIRKKLVTISSDRYFLHLEVRREDNQAVSARRGRETHSFLRQEEVIGRDEEREEIVKLLLEQGELEENVSVIPIVGMGGLGKTTLAQTAFNEETVQQHFELKMWVCVSDDFDLKLILQQIIKSATNNNNLGAIDSMDQLQKELQNVLNGKRYLLVLDDVWEEKREEWLRLKVLLLSGSRGSRIVVTTQSKKVAEITRSVQPYQLGILDKEKSWSLFEKMAFKEKEEERDPKIVDIGRQIAERCGGVPLAIRAIGGMLYSKSSESE
ncbi:putative disease resistance protein RGA3 [Morus notabilis]|uniref:putative disease resistance protein RGA3 n=1 Tax=Morus notabilis TaxID=981085 RepID=UPI000CED1FAD|nr:putative disease resistance protein RGA3 [Morus notabilis]